MERKLYSVIFGSVNAAKIENIAHLLIFTINSEYSSDSLGTSGVEKLMLQKSKIDCCLQNSDFHSWFCW